MYKVSWAAGFNAVDAAQAQLALIVMNLVRMVMIVVMVVVVMVVVVVIVVMVVVVVQGTNAETNTPPSTLILTASHHTHRTGAPLGSYSVKQCTLV